MAEARVAIVTGGLTGIGLACARALAAASMRVAVGARRGGEPAVQAAAEREVGPGTLALALDVRSADSVDAFCAAVERRLGPPGVLVNAAGIYLGDLVSSHDLAMWDDTLATNLTGPFLMTRAVLPGMMARGWGRIVNIASTSARVIEVDSAAYSASKAGLVALSRAAALEGGPHGVTCVSVSPTWIETDMLHASAEIMARAKGTTKAAEVAAIARQNPQNRLVQPQEVAALVAFLCSDAAAAITNEDIQVNAGANW